MNGCLIGLMKKDIVGPFLLATGDKPSSDFDPAGCKGDLLSNLGQEIPSSLLYCRRHEFGADILFAQGFLIHDTTRIIGLL